MAEASSPSDSATSGAGAEGAATELHEPVVALPGPAKSSPGDQPVATVRSAEAAADEARRNVLRDIAAAWTGESVSRPSPAAGAGVAARRVVSNSSPTAHMNTTAEQALTEQSTGDGAVPRATFLGAGNSHGRLLPLVRPANAQLESQSQREQQATAHPSPSMASPLPAVSTITTNTANPALAAAVTGSSMSNSFNRRTGRSSPAGDQRPRPHNRVTVPVWLDMQKQAWGVGGMAGGPAWPPVVPDNITGVAQPARSIGAGAREGMGGSSCGVPEAEGHAGSPLNARHFPGNVGVRAREMSGIPQGSDIVEVSACRGARFLLWDFFLSD